MRLVHVLTAAGAWLAAAVDTHAFTNVGGVFETEDRAGWIKAVDAFDSIDFVGLPDGTPLFDQYSDLGVLFTDENDTARVNDLYLDDHGAYGGLFDEVGLTMVFDQPQLWIGLDYPGGIVFELYRSGELIYESDNESDDFFSFGEIAFAGLISTQPFDTAVVVDPGVDTVIDNIYFGGVPSPAALALFGLAAAWRTRRRRAYVTCTSDSQRRTQAESFTQRVA